MANTIKDSYLESANHSEVLFQRGMPVLDFELNEAQRITRVNFQRLLEDAVQKVAYGEDFSPGSNDDGFKPSPGGADTVNFDAGSIVFQGVRLRVLGTSVTMAAHPGPGTTTYAIYARIEEVEITDPNALANLGETTRRKKTQVTLGVSTTGLGGVPASSGLDLWQGGVKYEPLCTVLRRAADSTVLPGDIKDLRRLLPSSVLTQIHRQSDFLVRAVVAPQYESPEAATLNYVARAGAIAVSTTFDTLLERHYLVSTAANGPAAFDGDIFQTITLRPTDATVSPKNVYYQRMGGSTGRGIYGSSNGSVGFDDANTLANPYYKAVDLTTPSHGEIRIFEQRPVELDEDVDYSGPRAVVPTINGRWTATCGDGSISHGDFTGDGSVDGAIRYFLTQVLPIGDVHVCHLRVKTGTYIFNMGATELVRIPDNVTLIIEGAGPAGPESGGTKITAAATTLIPAIAVLPGGSLSMKGVYFQVSGSPGVAYAIVSSGNVELDSCRIYGGVYSGAVEYATSISLPIRRIGISAVKTVFTPIPNSSGEITHCVVFGSCATTPGTDGLSRLGNVFEDCTFFSAARGSIIHVSATSTEVTNTIGTLDFSRCVFHPSYLHSATSPAGILTQQSSDAAAGYTHVSRVSFDNCGLGLVASVADPIVFDLQGGSSGGNGSGVIFDKMIMRCCDWRVYAEPARVHSPWYLGQNTIGQCLAIEVASQFCIDELVIDDVVFGYKSNPLTPDGYNQNGAHRSTTGNLSYAAGLTLHARKIAGKNITFAQASVYSQTADVFLAGVGDVHVEGLKVNVESAGDVAGSIPESRVKVFGINDSSDPTARGHYIRKINGLSVVSDKVSGQSVTHALLRVAPSGDLTLSNLELRGWDQDTGLSMDTTAFAEIGYDNWGFSGLRVVGGSIINVQEGIYVKLAAAGDVDHLRDIFIDSIRFVDIGSHLLYVFETNPSGNAAYHTTVSNFQVSNCSYRIVDLTEQASVFCTFYVGRASSSRTMNFSARNNDFTDICYMDLGANATLTPVGLKYNVTGNALNSVRMKVYSAPVLAGTLGLHTGHSAVGTSMATTRSWTDGNSMLMNIGTYEEIP